jgi:hypothetical protein
MGGSVHRSSLSTFEAIFLCVFFFLFQAPDNFVKSRTAELIGRYHKIFFRSLNAWPNSFESVVNADWRLKVFDEGPQRINCTSLLALRLVLIIFSATRVLLVLLDVY